MADFRQEFRKECAALQPCRSKVDRLPSFPADLEFVNGSGFKHTTTPAVGAATEVVMNAAGAGEVREYFSGGLFKEITLARGGKLAFGYSKDGAKDLTSATWPTVASGVFTISAAAQSYGYDCAGRIDEIGDSSGARSIAHQNGRLTQTAWNSGALAGYKVVKGLDSQGHAQRGNFRMRVFFKKTPPRSLGGTRGALPSP